MKKIYLSIYTIISILIVGITGYNVRGGQNPYLFDTYIMDYLSKRISPRGLVIMEFITGLGSGTFLIGLGLILVFYFYKKKSPRSQYYLLFNGLALSYLLNFILKNIFRRTRPLDYMLIGQGGYSYPSGHSMVSMSFYLSLAWIIASRVKNKALARLIYGLNLALALAIGFSRLYLGVHWPTDVVAGLLLGSLVGLWGIYLVEEKN